MHMVKKLSKMIDHELMGAEHYIKKAIKYKSEYPSIAKMLYDFCTDELSHVDSLQKELSKYCESVDAEMSADIKAICNFLFERHIEWINQVKIYQDQYKGY